MDWGKIRCEPVKRGLSVTGVGEARVEERLCGGGQCLDVEGITYCSSM